MASVVEICNRALDKLGEPPIVSLDDDVKASRACARLFAAVRDAVLRDHPWNCAIARALLPAEAQAPAWGFARAFPLPVDCLRVLAVAPDDGGPEPRWTVEGRAVLTDAPAPLAIRYLRRIADPNLFDPLLAEALAARLALELCEALTQSNTKRQLLADDNDAVLARARAADGQEGVPPAPAESPWVLARR
ncbi:MAG: hypothetical protein R3F55_00245 [Alphaproteobacteria bacterium]